MRKLAVAIIGVLFLSFNSAAQRPDLPGHLIIDWGLNSWATVPVTAEMNTWQSKTVNIAYYYDFAIGSKGFTFTPGFGLGLERYAFDNQTTLTSTTTGGVRAISVTPLNTIYTTATSFGKSKLGLGYIDIPVEFRYYTSGNDYGRGFRVALGGKVGLLYSSFTKVKLEDALADNRTVKDRQDLGINRVRYGIQGRVGFGGFSLFGYYELSKKFDVPPLGGANTQTLTIGISLTGF